MLRSDNKNGLKMDINTFFLAKTNCIIIHLESIMDFKISRKSHENGFFSTLFLLRALCNILQEFLELCGNFAKRVYVTKKGNKNIKVRQKKKLN